MNNKKIAIIATGITIAIVTISSIFYLNKPNKQENISTNTNEKVEEVVEIENDIVNFLKSIAGVKANNLEIINNPVGFKTKLLAPKESILNGIDYFLKNTENEKMEDLNVDIGDGFIKVKVNYEVIKNIRTPIEVKVLPSLNSDKNLVLKIQEVKFLDLKIAKWIIDLGVNNFIKDWFPKEQDFNVEFKEGEVIIDKENFEGIYLEKLLLDSSGLKINAIIDLEKIVSTTEK